MDSSLGVQQSGGPISDMYSDVYTTIVSSNQSAVMDFVYNEMTGPSQVPAGYRRLSAPQGVSSSEDFFATSFPQGSNPLSRVGSSGHSRKFNGLEGVRGRGSQPSDHRGLPISGRRQLPTPLGTGSGAASSDVLSSPVPLDSITPTVYNGHLSGGPPDYRVSSAEGESATAAELLTADANDLMDVDGTSSSGVGGSGSMNAGTSANAPAFRQGDEYYMMNENENIEINWPTSPGGVATASAGTV